MKSVKRSLLATGLLVLVLTFSSFSPHGLADSKNESLKAYFSFQPNQPYAGSIVTFDASLSSAASGEILKYEWDFDGDGNFEESYSLPTFRYVFEQTGRYQVTLKTVNERGQTATFSKQVKVSKSPVSTNRHFLLGTDSGSDSVYPGGRFKVAVVITINQAVSFLGLQETLPEGWNFRPLGKAGAEFKRVKNQGQWLWMESMLAGKVLEVTYQVTVPVGEEASIFEIDGSVSSRLPKFEIMIGKESKVKVIK